VCGGQQPALSVKVVCGRGPFPNQTCAAQESLESACYFVALRSYTRTWLDRLD